MYIESIIIENRAPFEHLNLNFFSEKVFVLSGINGAGKTTVLSYMVDALVEFAKNGFENEFKEKPNAYYRIWGIRIPNKSMQTKIHFCLIVRNAEISHGIKLTAALKTILATLSFE